MVTGCPDAECWEIDDFYLVSAMLSPVSTDRGVFFADFRRDFYLTMMTEAVGMPTPGCIRQGPAGVRIPRRQESEGDPAGAVRRGQHLELHATRIPVAPVRGSDRLLGSGGDRGRDGGTVEESE